MNRWISRNNRRTALFGVLGSLLAYLLFSVGVPVQAASSLSLGGAANFGILSGAGTTNTGNSVLVGDLGNYPNGSYTNSGSLNLTGTNHFADSVTQAAQVDLQTAFTTANAQVTTGTIPLELGGQTLGPGVYKASGIEPYYTMNGTLTFDAGGNSNAIFVIRGTRLTTTHDVAKVNLINGAQSCNIYWSFITLATEASVNLGAGSTFRGSVLIDRSITVNPDVVITGRLLSTSGTVSTNNDYIYVPTCSSPTPSPSPSVSPTPTPTPTGTCTGMLCPTPTPLSSPTPTISTTPLSSPTPTSVSSPTPTISTTPQIPIQPKGFVATGGGGSLKSQGALPKYLGRSAPVSISIPAISVKAKFVTLGLDKSGALQVPTTGTVAGWFSGAPTPGQEGPAIVVGHVDWNGKLGVFYYLKDLKNGDQVHITRADGRIVTYAVTQTLIVSKLSFPTNRVYGDINFAGLRLITCGGRFDTKLKRHVDNVIVFAKMVN